MNPILLAFLIGFATSFFLGLFAVACTTAQRIRREAILVRLEMARDRLADDVRIGRISADEDAKFVWSMLHFNFDEFSSLTTPKLIKRLTAMMKDGGLDELRTASDGVKRLGTIRKRHDLAPFVEAFLEETGEMFTTFTGLMVFGYILSVVERLRSLVKKPDPNLASAAAAYETVETFHRRVVEEQRMAA